MTIISENKLKKKQERKRAKQREKRWKRINSKIDNVITAGALLIVVGAGITEVLEAVKANKQKQKQS